MIVRLALSVMITVGFAHLALAQPAQKPSSGIGYPSVATAFDAVKAKPGVRIVAQEGWTVIEDRATMTVWSFGPAQPPGASDGRTPRGQASERRFGER
jgi:hypothetical protein